MEEERYCMFDMGPVWDADTLRKEGIKMQRLRGRVIKENPITVWVLRDDGLRVKRHKVKHKVEFL